MQTNSEIYQIENLKYRITDPTNKWVKVVGVVDDSCVNDVIIPSSITIGGEEYKVTSIREGAFFDCSILTSITIPNSVTSIGESAFWCCKSLTSINIPSSVTSIGYGAFRSCSLTQIKVDSGNPVYDSRNNCNAIIETKSNTLIAGCASTIIPNSVTSIGDGAFVGCKSLTSITLPNRLTSIGDYAFNGCSSLTSITIPSSVTSIGYEAFYECESLTSITIPSSVTSIGEKAFENCSKLTSITIPSNVTNIGDEAFRGCKSLTSITIPSSVTSIGNGVFWWCSSLTSIAIPSSVASIGNGAFLGCKNLTSINIPSSLNSIEHRAFSGCKSLTSITIPSSVTSIGKSVFSGCDNLAKIKVDSGNPVYDSRNNCNAIIETKSNTLIRGCAKTIIPSSVTSIGDGAFVDCKSLTSITIPSSVKSIGERAFSGCSSLTSITIPTHITNIDELDIPKGTRIIQENVKVSDKLELHYNQGLEFHKLADYDQAFENFKEAATKPFQFAPAQGEYAELLNGVHKHIMNNEMSQAQQAYNIYTNLTGETCSIVEICLQAGGIPESLRTDDGHAGAQYYMGLYYERGYSVQKDFAEAITWYRRAAEQGHAEAQFRLGVCYYIGESVDKSTEEAIKYCRKAAEKGHQMAKEMLEYMDQQLG